MFTKIIETFFKKSKTNNGVEIKQNNITSNGFINKNNINYFIEQNNNQELYKKYKQDIIKIKDKIDKLNNEQRNNKLLYNDYLKIIVKYFDFIEKIEIFDKEVINSYYEKNFEKERILYEYSKKFLKIDIYNHIQKTPFGKPNGNVFSSTKNNYKYIIITSNQEINKKLLEYLFKFIQEELNL